MSNLARRLVCEPEYSPLGPTAVSGSPPSHGVVIGGFRKAPSKQLKLIRHQTPELSAASPSPKYPVAIAQQRFGSSARSVAGVSAPEHRRCSSTVAASPSCPSNPNRTDGRVPAASS